MNKHIFLVSLSICLIFIAASPGHTLDIFNELDEATSAASFSQGQDKSEFEKYKQQHQAEFDDYKSKLIKEFQAYKKIAEQETERYTEKLSKVWDSPELTDKKVWVEYSKDLATKKRVDFENSTISISTVKLNGAKTPTDKELKQNLKDLLLKNQAQAFNDDQIAQAIEKKSKEKLSLLKTAEVKPTPILLPLVTEKSNPDTKEIDNIIDDLLANKEVDSKENKKGDKVVTVELSYGADGGAEAPSVAPPLEKSTTPEPDKAQVKNLSNKDSGPKKNKADSTVTPKTDLKPEQKEANNTKSTKADPNAKQRQTETTKKSKAMAGARDKKLPKGARQLESEVKKYAQKSKLDQALVYAIIETESAFNPMAKSPIPAYGLMQIVPSSAGMDATEQLFGKARILSPSYLYSRENNIEIGATYLNILYYRYLRQIKNPKSRLYCSIAAYNTGAGNVAKAFINTRKLSKALLKINTMAPKQVYEHLIKNLPYEETQRYLKKVVSRMDKYVI